MTTSARQSGNGSHSTEDAGAKGTHDDSTADPKPGKGAPPGADADKPQEIPAKGWLQIAKRGWAESKDDQVPLLSAGLAYYTFLAIFPTLIAIVTLYGLFADPSTISSQINSISAIPQSARDLIKTQLVSLSGSRKAGWGAALAIVLALWSASGGVSNLISAVNLAYDEKETRSFIKKRGLALLFTVGAILVVIIMLGLIAVAPPLLSRLVGDSPVVHFLLSALRWVVLLVVVAAALAIIYRYAPDRDNPKLRWTSVGAAVATVLWLLASIGFSIYASFGSYNKTYGTLAGIVILLFWLWITAYAILLGAEINAESEQQTIKDTTQGPPQPLGQRDAVKADSLPPGEGEADAEDEDAKDSGEAGADKSRR